MKKITRIIALISVILYITVMINQASQSLSSVENKDVTAPTTTKKMTYYVDFMNGIDSGPGNIEIPYQNFKTAYDKTKDGDRIIIVSDINIKTKDIPVFNKDITIEGQGESTTLFLHNKVKLANNLTLKNLTLSLSSEAPERSIYLNGHALTIDTCHNGLDSTKGITVFGGSDGKVTNSKNNAKLELISPKSKFYFDNIYAGGDNKAYTGNFELKLPSNTTVNNTIYANGRNASVTGTMNFYLGSVTANKFVKDTNSGKANLHFEELNDLSNEKTITNFDSLSLSNSKILLGDKNKFQGINGNVTLSGQSRIEVKQEEPWIIKGNLKSESGSEIMIHMLSKVNIYGILDGTFTFLTTEGGVLTTGDVKNKHEYFSATAGTGIINFLPNTGQSTYTLKKINDGNKDTWVAIDSIKNIDKVSFSKDEKINIDQNTFDLIIGYRKYNVYDEILTNVLNEFTFNLLDSNNNPIDDKTWSVEYIDTNNIKLTLKNTSLKSGTYILTLTDKNKDVFKKNIIVVNTSTTNEKTYTVIFDHYDKKNKTTKYSKANNLIDNLKINREGFELEGWYLDKEFKTQWNFKENKVNQNMTLYAKWTKINTEVPKEEEKEEEKIEEEEVDVVEEEKKEEDKPKEKKGNLTLVIVLTTSSIIVIIAITAYLIIQKNKEKQNIQNNNQNNMTTNIPPNMINNIPQNNMNNIPQGMPNNMINQQMNNNQFMMNNQTANMNQPMNNMPNNIMNQPMNNMQQGIQQNYPNSQNQNNESTYEILK